LSRGKSQKKKEAYTFKERGMKDTLLRGILTGGTVCVMTLGGQNLRRKKNWGGGRSLAS